MISNYLKMALRNFRRHKIYSFINIMGLAIGMACCILVFLYVNHELSYDKYHMDGDRIYRIAQNIRKDVAELDTARVATPLIPAVRESILEVESAARFQLATWDSLVERGEKKYYEDWVMIAENDLFDVFTIPFLRGNPEKALDRPRTVVITERVAQRYFGQDDPVGQTLRLWGNQVEVTGVISDCPKNTHLKYDIIISLNGFERIWNLDNWGWTGFYAYVKLRPNVEPKNFEDKIRHIADIYAKKKLEEWREDFTFYLQPISSIHLRSNLVLEIGSSGNPRDIYIFSVIGILILLISCINFTNLATARSTDRAKEVGVRKVMGAHRSQLTRQFLLESILASFVSLMASVIIVVLALPYFNMLTGHSFERYQLFNPKIILMLLGFSVFIGVMAGSYPAFLLSRFMTVRVLKGLKGLTSKGNLMRKVLVVAQFSITILMAIGTLSVYKQIGFMKNKHLGFDKHQKLIIPTDMSDRYESIKNEFLNYPTITGATACWNVPGRLTNLIEARLVGEIEEKTQSMNFYYVDSDFIPEYKIEIIAGRSFQKDIQTDIEGTFILNKTAYEAFGFSFPEEAIGKKMYEGGSGGIGTIIGVTEDFHYKGLQTKVEPLVLQWRPDYFSYLSLTVKTENLSGTLSFVRKKWNELQLGGLFSYFFLDEDFNRHYQSEESLGRLYAALTALAIFLSCLGLAGLSSFTAEQRTKEIGIRKILGASVPNILILLVSEFMKWVMVACVIAWPAAYFIINRWLQGFAYRTSLSFWLFGLSAAFALFVAILTVGYQSLKAAVANPVDSLRYE
ncbi:MAG: ABC transporter permease [Candidatus Aminicenantes bacterium]|nr:MAG: ABC transporter permease [Candidatus Aminicenantes bacterium]